MKTCTICDREQPNTEFVFLLFVCRSCQRKRRKAKDAARTLARLPCFMCGNPKTVGHHPDYDQPMQVVWLCEEHHNQLHREHGHDKSAATQKRNRERRKVE